MGLQRNLADYVILQKAAAAQGDGTAVRVTDPALGSYRSLTVQVQGITTATITWEGTIDGSNWVALMATNLNTNAAAVTAAADGIYRMTVTGLAQVRARISAFTSGAINVTGYLTTSD